MQTVAFGAFPSVLRIGLVAGMSGAAGEKSQSFACRVRRACFRGDGDRMQGSGSPENDREILQYSRKAVFLPHLRIVGCV